MIYPVYMHMPIHTIWYKYNQVLNILTFFIFLQHIVGLRIKILTYNYKNLLNCIISRKILVH